MKHANVKGYFGAKKTMGRDLFKTILNAVIVTLNIEILQRAVQARNILVRDMGAAFSGFNVRMAHQFLTNLDMGAVSQHGRGKGITGSAVTLRLRLPPLPRIWNRFREISIYFPYFICNIWIGGK